MVVLASLPSTHTLWATAVQYALPGNGRTVTIGQVNAKESKLMALCRMCSTVICCRVSPIQKADIVTMVPSLAVPNPHRPQSPSHPDRNASAAQLPTNAARCARVRVRARVLDQGPRY